MRRMLHKILLRIELHGALLSAIAAVRQHYACLSRVTELRIRYPFKQLSQASIAYRAGDLHASIEITRHKIGR